MLILASLSLPTGCQPADSADAQAEATLPVVVAGRAKRRDDCPYALTLYGRIEAEQSTAIAFETVGRIQQVFVEEGAQVRAGQELAILDTRSLNAERKLLAAKHKVETAILEQLRNGERKEVIAAAQADVSRLQAEAEEALRNVQRLTRLFQSNTATEADHDSASYRHRSLLSSLEISRQRLLELEAGPRAEEIPAQCARVEAAEAELQSLEILLEKAILRAPFAANIVRRIMDAGTVTSPNQPVLELRSTGTLSGRQPESHFHPHRPQGSGEDLDADRVQGRHSP